MDQKTPTDKFETQVPTNIAIRKLLDNFPKQYSKYPRDLYKTLGTITVLDYVIESAKDENDKHVLKKLQIPMIKKIVKILERVY